MVRIDPAPAIYGLPLGSVVGDFVLEEHIASSTTAMVYRGRCGDALAAVKVYPPLGDRPNHGARIELERDAQRRIVHPTVARLLDSGELSDGSTFLASEWIYGQTLEARLEHGPIAWPELIPILLALADGLSVLHEGGVLHRDLKPANIMLPSAGPTAAVILDFGHALVLGDLRVTDRGVVLGTAAYMAPEQAAGRPMDGRTDLYALGVTLYRALTGVAPFVDASAAEVLRRHQVEPVVPPRKRAPERDLLEEAEDLCLWMLAKDPARRLPSARVLAVTLRALQATTRKATS